MKVRVFVLTRVCEVAPYNIKYNSGD